MRSFNLKLRSKYEHLLPAVVKLDLHRLLMYAPDEQKFRYLYLCNGISDLMCR
jgi:hypothetical protein